MNILPLKSKTTPNKVIDDYVTSQLMEIEKDIEEMEEMIKCLLRDSRNH